MKVATVFSGIGSPEVALKRLGIPHNVVFACDVDKFARQTYLANHECGRWYDDVYQINSDDCPDFDLFIFGFPCQSYSMAGKRKGLEDERGKLIFPCLDLLRKKQPKYFVAENVKGLVNHDNGKSLAFIVEELTGCGYRVVYKVLNSLDFGVPQYRRRIFFVGIRNDADDYFQFPGSITPIPHLRNILDSSVDLKYYLTPAQKYSFNNENGYRVRKGYRNLDKEYARCLISGDTKHRNWVTDDNRFAGIKLPHLEVETPIRTLTPRECARLHGFPDSFIIPVSDSQAYRQFGNTITVNVLVELFRALLMSEKQLALAA